jgi:1,4-alpha-glucan branching enzyme
LPCRPHPPAVPPAIFPAIPCRPCAGAYQPFLQRRSRRFAAEAERIRSRYGSLRAYADLHCTLGPHLVRTPGEGRIWRWREYLPQAEAVWLVTDKGRFQRHARCRFQRRAEIF